MIVSIKHGLLYGFFAIATCHMFIGPYFTHVQEVGKPWFPSWKMFSGRGHGVIDLRVYSQGPASTKVRHTYTSTVTHGEKKNAPKSLAEAKRRIEHFCASEMLAGREITVEAREGTPRGWIPRMNLRHLCPPVRSKR